MGDAVFEPTILDLNFIRPGSLMLTLRTLKQKPRWANSCIKTIKISLGLCDDHPLVLNVREFVPVDSDAVSRKWIKSDDVTKAQVQVTTELSPYAINDTDEAANIVQDYIRDNCLRFSEVVTDADAAVQAVYQRVADHVVELRAAAARESADDMDDEVLELMERYCPLWWGIRNMMGSAWLIGDEMLGMEPVFEKGYPLYGKVSVPRQVVQTAGCLLNKATQPRQTLFLDAFRKAIHPGRSDKWGERSFYTIFLLVFVLLHECEDINKDRERYARQNFLKETFSLPEYVAALHESAHQMVSHWLGFASSLGVDFSTKEKLEASLGFLDESKRRVVVDSYNAVVNRKAPVRASPETWTEDLCFVTHMFQVPWAENSLYVAENPPSTGN